VNITNNRLVFQALYSKYPEANGLLLYGNATHVKQGCYRLPKLTIALRLEMINQDLTRSS
jgi:hypothetical protein